jgi:hypothetical protein
MFNMYLFNRALNQLDGKTPTEKAHGYKPDISVLLAFCWWEPVYAPAHDCHFPSESCEELCQWVGVAETTGDVLTYLLLTEVTGQLIEWSVVRSVVTTDNINLRAEMANSPLSKGRIWTLQASVRLFGLLLTISCLLRTIRRNSICLTSVLKSYLVFHSSRKQKMVPRSELRSLTR